MNSVVHALLELPTFEPITDAQLNAALAAAGIVSDRGRQTYRREMVITGKLAHAPNDNWQLPAEAYQSAKIVLTVSPAAAMDTVLDEVTSAVRRFRPLVSIKTTQL